MAEQGDRRDGEHSRDEQNKRLRDLFLLTFCCQQTMHSTRFIAQTVAIHAAHEVFIHGQTRTDRPEY